MKGQILIITLIIIGGVMSLAGYEFFNQSNTNTAALNFPVENRTAAATLSNQLNEGAPVQNSIKQAVTNGTLSLQDMNGSPEYSSQIIQNNATNIEIKYTTKLRFKNPKGAGVSSNKWPKFQVTNNHNITIDYDQQIKDNISSEINNITNDTQRKELSDAWNNYSFDSGERTYEINETYYGTYYNQSNSTFKNALPINDPPGTYYYSVLMGFTNQVNWHYSRVDNLYINFLWWNDHVATVRTDIGLGGDYGLRLPTTVGLKIPNEMISGQSYTLSTNIIGDDWSADQYSAANVLPENGNEFVDQFSFSISISAWIKVIGDIGPYTLDKDLDYGKSFKTPFGSGQNEKFPLPILEIPPDITGLRVPRLNVNSPIWLGIGLEIEPYIGSNKITAKWNAVGAADGNGLIEYNSPESNYDLSLKTEDNSNNYAIIKLTDYNYYFNICKLNLGARLEIGVTFMPLPPITSRYITIYSYDCSQLYPTEPPHLGIHQNTSADNVTAYINVTTNITFKPLYSANSAVTNITETINQTVTETPPIVNGTFPVETTVANWTETPLPVETTVANWTETPLPVETTIIANDTYIPTVPPTEPPTPPTVPPTEPPTPPTVPPTTAPTVPPTEPPTPPTVPPTEPGNAGNSAIVGGGN